MYNFPIYDPDETARLSDIGVADLYIMEHYFRVVDMSIPYDIEFLCFVTPSPGLLPRWTALVLPFLYTTWVALALALITVMLVSVLIAKATFALGVFRIHLI